MQVSAAETKQLTGEFGLVRKPWHDLRPIILVSSFLFFYLVLDWISQSLRPSSAISHLQIPAGLSLGLLLAYGLRYAPVVFLVGLVDTLWLHPLSVSFPLVALLTLSMTLVHAASAGILRRMASGPFVSLKYARDVVRFRVTGAVVSVTLAVAATADLALGGQIK